MIKPFFSINRNSILCRRDNFRRASGFTLIEVLVSMVILAIGLLGLASLQAKALKNNKDAYLYSQASLLAYEMGDRIKANKIYWGALPVNPIPDPTITTNGCNDPNQACAPDKMAAFDYAYWLNNVQSTLPAPTESGALIADIQRSSNVPDSDAPECTGGDPAICLILKWQRSDQSNAGGLDPDSSYRLEVTP